MGVPTVLFILLIVSLCQCPPMSTPIFSHRHILNPLPRPSHSVYAVYANDLHAWQNLLIFGPASLRGNHWKLAEEHHLAILLSTNYNTTKKEAYKCSTLVAPCGDIKIGSAPFFLRTHPPATSYDSIATNSRRSRATRHFMPYLLRKLSPAGDKRRPLHFVSAPKSHAISAIRHASMSKKVGRSSLWNACAAWAHGWDQSFCNYHPHLDPINLRNCRHFSRSGPPMYSSR